MLWAPQWQRGRLYLFGLHPTDSDQDGEGTWAHHCPEEEKAGVGKGSHCLENSDGF